MPFHLRPKALRDSLDSLVQAVFIVESGLEAIDGEGDNAGKYGGGAVDDGHNNSMLLAVVGGLIVAGKSNQATTP